MPLDTGRVTHLHSAPDEPTTPAGPPSIGDGPDVGSALRTARLARHLTPRDVADSTRIRQSYVEAIEEMRLDDLPSRPFTVGYIRSYAKYLGLDGEAAVSRFRVENPDDNDALRAPVGVRPERDPRLGLILIGGCLIVAAILLWNVAQRAMAQIERPSHVEPALAQQATGTPAANGGAVSLGAPLPAPVESTTPAPYVTPGLAAAAANGGSADAAGAALKERLASEARGEGVIDVSQAPVLGTPFQAKGPVHGPPSGEGTGVVLQARKSGWLLVHRPDGSVYFAKLLVPGEAFRVPAVAGLTAEVSDPTAFDVFTRGVLTGRLTSAQTTLAKLTPAPPAAPAPAAAAVSPPAPAPPAT
ncbi:MAG: cell division protein FtsQ [Caulobacter sp.]|nr:cell division protein FtsQ [Caulobacter sp.]